MTNFGWSLPPGCSTLPGEETYYCPTCGKSENEWPQDREPEQDEEGFDYCSPQCRDMQKMGVAREVTAEGTAGQHLVWADAQAYHGKDYGRDASGRQYVTDPYGTLAYCIGTADDFVCFDFAVIGPDLCVIESVLNSETGSFIQGFDYWEGKHEEMAAALERMIDAAITWCYDNNLKRPAIVKPANTLRRAVRGKGGQS